MPNIDKKKILLEQIIKEYIKNPEPIGSEYLKMHLDIKISSATIRNYFKKMVEDGELEQLHISSGRVPTIRALKNYWQDRLLPLVPLKVDRVENLIDSAKEVGIFCIVKFYKPNRFVNLIKVKEKYLILELDDGEIVLSYSNAMERFLESFLNIEIRDLLNIATQVCANELKGKILHFLRREDITIEGSEELIDMAKKETISHKKFITTINGRVLESVQNGLYFEKIVPYGYLAVKQDIVIEDLSGKLFFLGSLCKNYEEFYELLDS